MIWSVHDNEEKAKAKESLKDIDLAEARAELHAEISRAYRIIGIGDSFNDDEFLLLLLILRESEVVSDFLAASGLGTLIDTGLIEGLQKKIQEAASTPKNGKAFRIANGLMNKNCPVKSSPFVQHAAPNLRLRLAASMAAKRKAK